MITIEISGKQWSVDLALTPEEIQQGLSGVESIPPDTGMFFDLGYEHNYVPIDVSKMLFSIDIVLMNNNLTVLSVMRDVYPNKFNILGGPSGVRCFLEVNAGEADDVNPGDVAVLTGYELTIDNGNGNIIENMINIMIPLMMVVMMMGMATKAIR